MAYFCGWFYDRRFRNRDFSEKYTKTTKSFTYIYNLQVLSNSNEFQNYILTKFDRFLFPFFVVYQPFKEQKNLDFNKQINDSFFHELQMVFKLSLSL